MAAVKRDLFEELILITSIFLLGLASSFGFFMSSGFLENLSETSAGIMGNVYHYCSISSFLFFILSLISSLWFLMRIYKILRKVFVVEVDIKEVIQEGLENNP